MKGEKTMDKKTLEETKKLNQQSAANRGNTGASNSDMSNMSEIPADGSLEETKKMNQQSALNKGNTGFSNANMPNSMDSAVEETKKLNQKSASKKNASK